MEDCKVNYDMTVRNAAGVIIQYLYGEDGMDACKIDSQAIPHITMDKVEIAANYGLVNGIKDFKGFVSEEIMKDLSDSSLEDRMLKHHDQIITDREHVIVKMYQGKLESSVMYPVALNRILVNIQNTYAKYGANIAHDLSPIYVLDKIDELIQELVVTKHCPGNKLFQILLRAYLTPKRVIIKHRLTKNAFDAAVEQIKFRFFEALAHPSEMVGVIAAQSIGEPATQLTLNSVAYDTELLLNINGVLKRVQIGEYIDSQIERSPRDQLELHPNDTTLAYIKPEFNVSIQSCDENGKIAWKRIEAVTRHPVVNEDGTNTVVKISLLSGRDVVATKAKSFLMRINNKIVPVEGKDLKVGDYLPVSKALMIKDNIVNSVDTLDVSQYLSKKEYIFMSEVEKGVAIHQKHGNYKWWKRYHGSEFQTPYRRSDSFTSTFITKPRQLKREYKSGCVYPAHGSLVKTTIPERIPLDKDFGFFIGAYLAEGMVCSSGDHDANMHHVLIANIDEKFAARCIQFGDKYNIRHHVDVQKKNNGLSVTYRFHSVIMATLMEQMCGNGSNNKRIPEFVFQAPDEFVMGLVDGYFSGDGCMNKKCINISAFSVSRGLLDDMQLLLSRFGILASIKVKDMEHIRKKKPNSVIQDGWLLEINGKYVRAFARQFTSVIDYKQSRLSYFKTLTKFRGNAVSWNIVPNVVLEKKKMNINLERIDDLITSTNNKNDLQILQDVQEEDIIYDRIIKIEEIPNPTPYVYDLTVQDTKTFNSYNNVCLMDTFHSAGSSEASKGVRGVPRLNELLAVSKKIKTPIMNIYLKPDVSMDKVQSLEIMNNIRTIRFRDIITSSSIYFDPSDFNTTIVEDRGFIDYYRGFQDEAVPTPWLLRMEFDRAKMLDFKVDMIELRHVLYNFYGDKVTCMFSDDNAEKLVMRIRINKDDDDAPPSDDLLTDLKALEHNIIENVPIKGVRNISRAALEEKTRKVYNPITMMFDNKKEWMIFTEGTNLRDVLALSIVDAPRTITNDVNEIYEVLGVEAARQALYNEINELMESAAPVNYRHIALLVDVMTNRGNILSVNRFGINRGDIGPLAKCSFEETTDKLIKAGVFAEYDKINGVSANVMLGQIAPCGTGDVGVIMDQTLIEQMPDVSNEEVIHYVMDDAVDQCAPDVLQIDMPTHNATIAYAKLNNDLVFVD